MILSVIDVQRDRSRILRVWILSEKISSCQRFDVDLKNDDKHYRIEFIVRSLTLTRTAVESTKVCAFISVGKNRIPFRLWFKREVRVNFSNANRAAFDRCVIAWPTVKYRSPISLIEFIISSISSLICFALKMKMKNSFVTIIDETRPFLEHFSVDAYWNRSFDFVMDREHPKQSWKSRIHFEPIKTITVKI